MMNASRHGIPALVALLLLAPALAAAQGTTIYKWVDDKGVVHYSSEPVKGAERLQVDTAPAGVVMPKAPAPAKPAAGGGAGYTALSFASPKSGEEFRDNDGSLSVTLALDPALQSGAGHAVVVSLDGKALPQRYLSPSLTLTDLDRGVHTLQASVVDADGKVLITSGTLSFTLHQSSALAPRGPGPRPR